MDRRALAMVAVAMLLTSLTGTTGAAASSSVAQADLPDLTGRWSGYLITGGGASFTALATVPVGECFPAGGSYFSFTFTSSNGGDFESVFRNLEDCSDTGTGRGTFEVNDGSLTGCAIVPGDPEVISNAGQEDCVTLTRNPGKHVRIELKAWIPFATIPDPVSPEVLEWPDSTIVRAAIGSSAPAWLSDCVSILPATLDFQVAGDGHPGYDGSYRAMTVAEFDWEGGKIVNFDARDYTSLSHRTVSARTPGGQTRTCESSGQAPRAGTAEQTGDTAIDMTLDAAFPLLPAILTPPLTATARFELSGDPDDEPTIALEATTDLFPSYGVAVYVDGEKVGSPIMSDRSCVDLDGMVFAANLAYWLLTSAPKYTTSDVRGATNTTCQANAQIIDGAPYPKAEAGVLFALSLLALGDA